jgi:hypothetical protein
MVVPSYTSRTVRPFANPGSCQVLGIRMTRSPRPVTEIVRSTVTGIDPGTANLQMEDAESSPGVTTVTETRFDHLARLSEPARLVVRLVAGTVVDHPIDGVPLNQEFRQALHDQFPAAHAEFVAKHPPGSGAERQLLVRLFHASPETRSRWVRDAERSEILRRWVVTTEAVASGR